MAIGAELTLADHMRCLNPRQGRGGGMERLEAHNRSGDTLNEAVRHCQVVWPHRFGYGVEPENISVNAAAEVLSPPS
jgi:hypothetical protein